MKKHFYVASFVILGFLIQLLIHGFVEQLYIKLLVSDFSKYSFGLSWADWFGIHKFGTVALLVVGMAFGLWQGLYWWPRLYTHDGKRRNLRT